jgi:hypothetical protein
MSVTQRGARGAGRLVAPSRKLLGLTGVINQIRLTFDGTTSPVAPNGVLLVEKM